MCIYKLEIISTKRKYFDNSNLKKRTSKSLSKYFETRNKYEKLLLLFI